MTVPTGPLMQALPETVEQMVYAIEHADEFNGVVPTGDYQLDFCKRLLDVERIVQSSQMDLGGRVAEAIAEQLGGGGAVLG